MKIQKKKWGGVRGEGGGRLGGQGGCDRRIEVIIIIIIMTLFKEDNSVFGKIHKKKIQGGGVGLGGGGVRVGRVRVDVNEELKFL